MPVFSFASYLFDPLSVGIIAISLAMVGVGLWVWTRDADDIERSSYGKAALLLAGVLFPIGLSLASLTRGIAFYWDRWSWALVCFVPAAVFSFEATHLGLGRLRKWVLPLYAVGFVFAALIPFGLLVDERSYYVYAWGELQKITPFGYAFIAYFLGVFLYFFRLHDRKRREKGLSEAVRRRYRLTFFGWIFGTFAALDFLGYFGIPWPPTSFIFFLLWLGFFAYGILKYRLFQVTEALAAPAIIGSMPGALFVVDMDGEILIVNPYASRLTRVAESEMRGRRVTEFVPKAAALLLEAAEHPTLGPIRSEIEATLKDGGGGERQVSLSAMPILDSRGVPKGVTIIAADIGKMKEQMETIATQKTELEAAVAGMSKIQEQLVGRELKMIELKKEIERLKKKDGP